MVAIPKSVLQELEAIKKQKPLGIQKEKRRAPEEILAEALKNLNLLNAIANTEPMALFLQEGKIRILEHFEPKHPDYLISHGLDPFGELWLETICGTTGLFYWLDADYPANRKDSDHILVTESYLRQWHQDSIARFAALTEKEIWGTVKKWLRFYRETI